MTKTSSFVKKFYEFVWASNSTQMSHHKRTFIETLRIAHLVIRDLFEGMLTLQAMSLVYTTLLSIVPLLAVSFSVLKGFGVHNQIQPMLLNFLAPLGEQGVEITQRIIGFVENTKAGVLGSLGLALLFYTVVSLIQKIEKSFNYTWRVTEQRPLAQRFSDYLSVVLIGPLLIFSAIGITASVTGSAAMQQLEEYEAVSWFIKFISRLVPYLLVIAAFTVVYIFVPNTRVKVRSALVGALVAGILWETTGWVFAVFVVTSAKYAAIYSAFATLIIFMIWLYACWMILLIGASIAFYVQFPEYRNLQERDFHLSNRMKEKIALLSLAVVGSNYYDKNESPLSVQAIAQRLHITPEVLAPIIDQLVAHNVLVKTESTIPGLLPAQPPETQKILDILQVVRTAEEHGSEAADLLPKTEAIELLYSKMESALTEGFGDISLKDISFEELSHPSREDSDNTETELIAAEPSEK
ncbi:MAG: YhjD/YihY/BrkB family envelope integrity protein [Gammaproteobacteria bacterium]|jgi:membrane protein